MRVLALFAVLCSYVRATCPTLNCSSLAPGICASYEGLTTQGDELFYISESRCSNGTYCTVGDFETYRETLSVGSTLNCTSTSAYVINYTATASVNCSSRVLNESLASGSYPKICPDDDEDSNTCLLQNGSKSYCECGYDGNAYCAPSLSSNAFDDYWTECSANGGMLTSVDHAVYWELKSTYYVKYISAYSCAHNIFYEFNQTDAYDYIGDAASVLLPLAALLAT